MRTLLRSRGGSSEGARQRRRGRALPHHLFTLRFAHPTSPSLQLSCLLSSFSLHFSCFLPPPFLPPPPPLQFTILTPRAPQRLFDPLAFSIPSLPFFEAPLFLSPSLGQCSSSFSSPQYPSIPKHMLSFQFLFFGVRSLVFHPSSLSIIIFSLLKTTGQIQMKGPGTSLSMVAPI